MTAQRIKRSKDELTQMQAEALSNARSGQSFSNYPAIYTGFMAKGISESDIRPRENVFTFNAWKALGRVVRKGEKGVMVATIIRTSKEVEKDGKIETVATSRPWATTVFHVSQTDPISR